MAARCTGYILGGVEYSEPPKEMIERVRQAFQEEYDMQFKQVDGTEEDLDEQRNAG